jgi:transposase-like protein
VENRPLWTLLKTFGQCPGNSEKGAELLSFFNFPRHLWKKLRTTNIIERCFVEVRHSRPMVCFVNVQSVDRIIYSIFQRFNLEWKNRTLRLFTQAA